MKRSIEARIKFNTVIVYLIIAILFFTILAYIYSFRGDLDRQKRNIELYSAELSAAENLINKVNDAQADVNRFVVTKDSTFRKKFEVSLAQIKASVDSLSANSVTTSQHQNLAQIDTLLGQKGQTVALLNNALIQKDLLDNIDDFLKNYKPGELKSIISKAKHVELKDSIITLAGKKKTLWKRVADVFSTKASKDSIKIKSQKTEENKTGKSGAKEHDTLTPRIKKYIIDANTEYASQLGNIESQINGLVATDQKIAGKISSLLINYYSQIIHARFEEIKQSDSLIKQNNNYTLIGGLIALIPIIFSLITILRNVNRGKRARVELENANARIREVMKSRHQLLLSVSHDIKTPLNSILGNLDLSQKDGSINKQEVNSMKNSGKHILTLLDNLLGFSSMEQGKLVLQSTPFHLDELCAEVKDMFVPLCEKKNLKFNSNFEFDKNLVIRTDNLKLKQIIINILSNAVKYTVKGTVAFDVSYKENNLLVKVQDSGVGVSKDQLKNIFEPFVRIKENNSLAEGSGFGMYVVKGLVDLFGGTIKADSTVGKGSTFTLTIPVETITESPVNSSKSKHIIIIDDDSSLLLTLKTMVHQLGHTATICLGIDELKEKLGSIQDYDLAITDMEMGASSGLDSLEMIRKVSSETPVILMTARSEINEQQVQLMGFNACLPKPISLDTLSVLLGQSEEQHKTESTKQNAVFEKLGQILGNDESAMREVLSTFSTNSQNDLAELRKAIDTNDFKTAQQKCHKMLSMFMQIAPENQVIPLLKQMDSSREKDKINYPGWTNDVTEIVKTTEQLIEEINTYLQK